MKDLNIGNATLVATKKGYAVPGGGFVLELDAIRIARRIDYLISLEIKRRGFKHFSEYRASTFV